MTVPGQTPQRMRRRATQASATTILLVLAGCGRTLPVRPGDAEPTTHDASVPDGEASTGSDASMPPPPQMESGVSEGGPEPSDMRDAGAPPVPTCGNGTVETGEECDGMDLAGETCWSLGYDSGFLSCSSDCGYELDNCRGGPPPPSTRTCIREVPGELPRTCAEHLCECDADAVSQCGPGCWDVVVCVHERCEGDASDPSCILSRCTGGNLNQALALSSCYRSPACQSTAPPSVCGNGVAERGEACDGADLAGRTCRTEGLGPGMVYCTENCELDVDDCGPPPPVCGDGVAEGDETCDRLDLRGETCESQGFDGGELLCDPATCELDAAACAECGNGRLEPEERCEGDDLRGQTCASLGFTGGTLACEPTGCAYDVSGCARCGNGVAEAGEACDGNDLQGRSCNGLGLGSGSLACTSSCVLDASDCSMSAAPECGNDLVEGREQCDGSDLLGSTCEDFGFNGGELACNSSTCRFDLSMCRNEDTGFDCRACGMERCSGAIQACTGNPRCVQGLSCVADQCTGNATLGCTLGCFDGNTNLGLTAFSMFACITAECGSACVGTF